MPIPDGSSRFDRCRCALTAPLEGGTVAPIPYRRCPVGVIADVDCPEFAGARCGYFEDRGEAPPTTLPRTEVPMLAAELAADYLTPRYRRRLAALRGGGAPLPALAVDGRGSVAFDPGSGGRAPTNVPADRSEPTRAEPRAVASEHARPESQPVGDAERGRAGGAAFEDRSR